MRSLGSLFLILFISGCDIFNTKDDVRRVILQPGMEFTYQSSFFETDSTFTDTLDYFKGTLGYFDKITVKVSVLDSEITIAGHENLIQLRTTPEGSDGSLEETHDTWYIQNSTSLTEIAYRNPGIVRHIVPKIAEMGDHRKFNSAYSGFLETRTLNFILDQKNITDYTGGRIPADSIQIREDPRIVLLYPVDQNNEWTAITNPFTINRKVIEVTENELTDQNSWTATVQSWYDPQEIKTEYFDWIDRFNKHGLISRVIKLTSVRRDDFGNETGRFHTKENVELVKITYPDGD